MISCLAIPPPARAAETCPPDGHCTVASGFYMVHTPLGWDGRTPLPVLMHFHGYRESAGDMMTRADLRAFADRHMALLVIPQGQGDTWSHPGSPAQYRDEFRFIDEVAADLDRAYPIDHQRFLVSGFSQGAAMVWNLACYRGAKFSAFLAVSGTFWTPQPETCPSGAQNLIEVHGLADRTVPLEGRPIRNGAFRQGDVVRAVAMMRQANGCTAANASAARKGELFCEISSGCASGKELALCLHRGGHDFDHSWLEIGWDLVLRKAKSGEKRD